MSDFVGDFVVLFLADTMFNYSVICIVWQLTREFSSPMSMDHFWYISATTTLTISNTSSVALLSLPLC